MKLGLLLFTIAFAVALLVGAGSARAQSSPPPSGGSDAAPTQNPAAAAAEPPAPSDKKVWTNEDMKDLRTQPDLSTFEKSGGKFMASKGKPAENSRRDARWYRNQIAKSEGKLPAIDQQIENYRAALKGEEVKSTGGAGYCRVAGRHC
ncbi:MAG: hypothetical protein WBC04_09215 [Candidatus Acidiferrales bacterium]